MYYRIREMKGSQFSISQISRELGISRKTVYFYLSMDEAAFEAWLSSGRSRKLSDYEEVLKNRLKRYPDLSSYQLHDWLLEHYPDLEASRRTLSDFVRYLREKYHLPKPPKNKRVYEQVAELPYGKQAQVDWGSYVMQDASEKQVKVHFFVMVLSRSRAKYVYFQLEHFVASEAVSAHEAAFEYFGGIPQQVVYDQDSILISNENRGDLVLTETFGQYVRDRALGLHFCRKADPESKGKIESVVRYVKSNFLRHRTFHSIDQLNEEALAWLKRTANGQLHGTTHQVPAEELEVERAHLLPYTPIAYREQAYRVYAVRKDNSLSYKGNSYSLPYGTYQGKGSKIWVKTDDEHLIICQADKTEIARHRICLDKGKTIRNNNHFRDKSETLDKLTQEVAQLFADPQAAQTFFAAIRQHKARYFRDQLVLIRKSIGQHPNASADEALTFCLKNQSISAADFRDFIAHLDQPTVEPAIASVESCLQKPIQEQLNLRPQQSNIEQYEELFYPSNP